LLFINAKDFRYCAQTHKLDVIEHALAALPERRSLWADQRRTFRAEPNQGFRADDAYQPSNSGGPSSISKRTHDYSARNWY
jgi:hypothetical protein